MRARGRDAEREEEAEREKLALDHFEGVRQLWKGPKMDLKQEGKKVIEKADAKLTSLSEIVTRKGWTKWAVLGALGFVLFVVAFLLWPGKARATGYEHGPQGAVAGAVAMSGATAVSGATGVGGTGGAGGSATSGAVSVGGTSVNTRAYAGGSTGLTGTARCLQSFGFAFNALSATYVDKNCVGMVIAEELCGEGASGLACRKAAACANPDVPDYAKKAIGCPKE